MSRAIIVEVGQVYTKLVWSDYNKKHNRVYKTHIYKTPEETVEEGYVRDIETYVGMLRHEMKKAGITGRNIVFTIGSSRVLSREVVIPLIQKRLIPRLIESERKEYFPMDISDHLIAFDIVGRDEEKKKMKLMLYAAPTYLIRNYQAIAVAGHFNLLSIDCVGNSVYRWVCRELGRKLSFLLQINENNSMLTVVENGSMTLQRNMNFGSEVLCDAFMAGGNPEGFDRDTAIALIRREGFPDTGEKNGLWEATRPFIGNLSRIVEFYVSKNRNVFIPCIYLTGAGASVPGLDDMISDELGLPVKRLDETTELLPTQPVTDEMLEIEGEEQGKKKKKEKKPKEKKPKEPEDPKFFDRANLYDGVFIASIGASYRSVDFLEASAGYVPKESFSLLFMWIVLILVAVAGAAWTANAMITYDETVKRKEEIVERVAGEEAQLADYDRLYSIITQYDTIQALADSTRNNDEYLNMVMEMIEKKIPTNAIITSMTSSDSGVNISLVATSRREAAKTMLQMRSLECFRSVAFSGLSDDMNEDGLASVSFNASCSYPDSLAEVDHED